MDLEEGADLLRLEYSFYCENKLCMFLGITSLATLTYHLMKTEQVNFRQHQTLQGSMDHFESQKILRLPTLQFENPQSVFL